MNPCLSMLRQALSEKDMDTFLAELREIGDEIGSDATRDILNQKVLPSANQESLEWYWSLIASPIQLTELLNAMSDKATKILSQNGFVIGTDFSFSIQGNVRKLHLSDPAKQCLTETVPPARLNTLRLLTHEPIDQ